MSDIYIAVPMGDPAGVGPEIVAKALSDVNVLSAARVLAVGDSEVMESTCRACGIASRVNAVCAPSEGEWKPGVINVLDLSNVDMKRLKLGEKSAMCGQAAFAYIKKSIELARSGLVAAVATAPINKESLAEAGVPFIGHTEIFGELTGTADPLTMFEVRGLRVFFLSRHVSLRRACDLVTKDRIIDYVKRCTEALNQLGVDGGVMAIAGLNPHSGENGLFGDEEVNHVMPAVKELNAQGYNVVGPIAADSVFHLALQGRYTSVLSLYHDQGHIATKTLDFERTISITCGMPILRTSVDHGTAFDIAGMNTASPVSMTEAILLAVKYAPAFRRVST